ncbi:MAG: CPBP family intramembrane metalloprotease [Clostridia bacterium]|nr:CPBP family intramembrane metalloprotease [Clostridia bacterium]
MEKRLFYRNDDSGKMFLICLIAKFLMPLLFSMIAGKIAEGKGIKATEITESLVFNAIYLSITLLLYLAIFFAYNKINKVSFKAVNLKFKMPWHTYLILIAVGVLSLLGVNYFIGATDNFLSLIGFPIKEGLPMVNPTSFPLYLLALLLMAVIPAICEELLFRGVILHGLRDRFGTWASIALSALMFALMHGNLQQFVYPFILGGIMGWLVTKTGSLFSSMLVHFINNFLVVTFAYIQNITGFSLALPNTWWFYLVAFGLLFATFGILWLIEKFYFKGKTAKDVERTSQKTSIYVYLSIGISVLMLVITTILQFVSNIA